MKKKVETIQKRSELLIMFSAMNYSPSTQRTIANHMKNINRQGDSKGEAEAERIMCLMKKMPEKEVLENL